METFKQFKNAAGEILSIIYDNSPENPREWCNIGEFCVGKRCRYIDNEIDLGLEFCNRNDDEKSLNDNKNIAAWLPVYVYDHSGACMNTSGFSCPWDSGQIGYIVVTKETVIREYGWKRITRRRREKLEEYLRGEVETYSQYMQGDVYGFIITADDDSEDIVDSCYGYYGDDGIAAILEDHPDFTEEI